MTNDSLPAFGGKEISNPKNQGPSDPSAEAPAPAAVLYIANLRSSRSQMVYGQSGHKYPFRYSKTYDKLVREYASKEVFQREELDLRRNTRNPLHVCTLLGPLDPVQSALDAIDALAKATLKVAAHRRREALEKIAALAAKELEALGRLSESVPAAAPAAPAAATPKSEPPWTERQLQQMSMGDLKAAEPGIEGCDRKAIIEAILKRQTVAKQTK